MEKRREVIKGLEQRCAMCVQRCLGSACSNFDAGESLTRG